MKRNATDLIFKLEHQFTLYLQRCQVTREQLSVDQLREMRRAFYGGCGQMLFLVRDDILDIPKDRDRVIVLELFVKQLKDFWNKEQENYEAGLDEIHPTMPAKCADCDWVGQIKDLTKPEKNNGLAVCPKCSGPNILYR